MKFFALALFLVSVSAFGVHKAGGERLENNPLLCDGSRNTMAVGLPGTWEFNTELARTLSTELPMKLQKVEVSFSMDLNQVNLFETLLKEIKNCAYLAGEMVFKATLMDGKVTEIRSPFILTTRNGNPVLFYDERGYSGAGPIADHHPSHIMFVNSVVRPREDGPLEADPTQDILFIGGDHSTEPKIPMKRKTPRN